MLSGSLGFLVARERTRQLQSRADQLRRTDDGSTPVTGVTLRYANAADADRLSDLAQLDSAPVPHGRVLIAVIDGRLRAALPLDGESPIADPFYRGTELIELLRMRAAQLA